jgi:hypothetical protein
VLQHKNKTEDSTVSHSQVNADTTTTAYDNEVATSADADNTVVPETQPAAVDTESHAQQHMAQPNAVAPPAANIDTNNDTQQQQQQQQQQQMSRAARRQQSNSSGSGMPIHEMFANWAKSPWINALGQVGTFFFFFLTQYCMDILLIV